MTPSTYPAPRWWVICLCAQWCGVCREWREAFDQAAAAHPQLHFAWVDVEDEADAMGDVDIETFPTVLIVQGDQPLFLGPIPPSATQLSRMVAGFLAEPRPSPSLPAGTDALVARLATQVLPNS